MTLTNIELPEPEVLVNATLFLMTQHARSHCPVLGRAIAEHFGWLARHPAAAIAPSQHRFYRQLAVQWAQSSGAQAGRDAGHGAWVPGPAAYLQ